MGLEEEEEDLLRSVALRNATSILRARQRAEEELVAAKDELERRTLELKEETRILEVLNRTATTLASNLDLESLLRSVTDAGTELSGAELGAFFHHVTGGNGDAYRLGALSGASREAFEGLHHLPDGPLPFGPAFRGERVIRSDDILEDPQHDRSGLHHGLPTGHLPVRSYLAVPVCSRSGEVLGALCFGHSEPGVFTERSERIVLGIAGQAAIAIDNAALYEAAQAAAEERSRLLERERVARVEAERANAMKDDFLATLSHELRTPVNAILGWVQVLQLRTMTPAELKRGLETIERNTRVQTRLIEDLLDMNRITSGNLRLERQLLQVAPVVEAAVETVRHEAEAKTIRLETDLDARSGWVSGDPGRLQQVVWNLLSNAIKFTPAGGRVTVRMEQVSSEIVISVVDTGAGIPSSFLPHVFDRFRQADGSTTREVGGLGVGLAIVHRLVELHGGSVSAHSDGEGRGSTFAVRLPLSPVQSGAEAASPGDMVADSSDAFEHSDLSGVTVLIVDDERDARDLLDMVLSECGAEVLLASDALEALSGLEKGKPDVIICDLGLPGVDGYEFLGWARTLGPEEGGRVPAIALTGSARAQDRRKALRAGFLAHLTKPVEPGELIATVASVAGWTSAG